MNHELTKAAQDSAQMAKSVADRAKDADVRELALAVFRLALAVQEEATGKSVGAKPARAVGGEVGDSTKAQ